MFTILNQKFVRSHAVNTLCTLILEQQFCRVLALTAISSWHSLDSHSFSVQRAHVKLRKFPVNVISSVV